MTYPHVDEKICHICGRRLTVWESYAPSTIVHEDGVPHRWCNVCSYRRADPEDYGRPTWLGAIRVIVGRWRKPKA